MTEKLPELPDKKPEEKTKKKSGKKKVEKKPSLWKRLFQRKKEEKDEAEEIVQKMREQPARKRRRLRRKSLQEYLEKAGYSVSAEKVRRNCFYVLLGIFMLITLYVLGKGFVSGAFDTMQNVLEVTGFLLALWTVVFGAAILFGLGVIYFYLDYMVYKRTRALEQVLPDFLQLASANIAAGMSIDRALWYSIRPNFGVLAKEMEDVAKATMSGESLEDSLRQFTKRYDSDLLTRSVAILIEGLHSGGELADLLNKIALNIQEIEIMKKEMAANVTTYAIFILVAAVGIAPVLFGLATQLLEIIVQITGTLDLSSSAMFTLGSVDPVVVKNFTMFSYMMLVVSVVFGASIVSVIRKGNILEGVKTIPVYVVIAILIYRMSISVLGGMFGSLI